MEKEYEFEGKTKEEALAKASEELGLRKEQLDFEVVSYGSTGIFGLVGVKKARIKVLLPDSANFVSKSLRETENDIAVDKPTEVPETDLPQTADAVEEAKAFLETMVSFIVEDAVVSAKKVSDRVVLTIDGGNSALLIGKHGRTLDALQYIVQKSVQKKGIGKVRFTVDIEGYRERRKAWLTQLALRLGDKVKRSGKPATINPMNAYDRRIVHVALKDDAKVRTQSMGSGALRKLVIFPQKKRN